MLYISETKNKSVNFLLHPLNYTQFYHKLKTVLDDQEIQIFAKPDVNPDTTSWLADVKGPGKVVDFEQLPSEEKDNMADHLEQFKDRIVAKLSGIKELAPAVKHLFTVPDANDIKAVQQNDVWFPVLIQWACTSNNVTSNIDPLSTLLFRPRNNTDFVSINFMYTNGDIAAGKEFYIEYNGRESREKTNAEGVYNRGRCKLGSTLLVYDKLNNDRVYIHDFNVAKGARYLVNFPLLTGATVTVIDQNKRPLPGERILLTTNGEEVEYSTNEAGMLILDNLEVGKELLIRDGSNTADARKYMINREGNELVFQVNRNQFAPAKITVINSRNENEAGHELLVEIDGVQGEYMTNAGGEIGLGKLRVDSQVKVTNKSDSTNTAVYTVAEGDNDFIFKLVPSKEVKVRLVDGKNRVMPGIKVDFTYNGATQSLVTNDAGVCVMPHSSFIDREKVKVFIHMPSRKVKKEKKEKVKEEKKKD